MTPRPNCVIVLTGPTGSGKSALGLEIAKRIGGEIINSDSVQVYREIQKISFAPLKSSSIEHHLYGFVGSDEYFSVSEFLLAAKACIERVIEKGSIPILIGGSPLYQRLMIDGISQVSFVKPEPNTSAIQKLNELGMESFYRMLIDQDPSLATKIHPNDSYRMLKAFDMMRAGVSPSKLGNLPKIQILDSYQLLKFCLLPPKEFVQNNCRVRIESLQIDEIVEEVLSLARLSLPPHYPAQKAIGVPEIRGFLDGRLSLQEALDGMLLRTYQYVKRQYTWFNNKYQDFTFLNEIFVPDLLDHLFLETPLRNFSQA